MKVYILTDQKSKLNPVDQGHGDKEQGINEQGTNESSCIVDWNGQEWCSPPCLISIVTKKCSMAHATTSCLWSHACLA